MTKTVVAIDGPSASGKSTVAKKVAAALGCLYVDSGAVYRAVTWLALQKGIASDVESCKSMVENVGLECFVSDGAVRFRIEGFDLAQELRTDAVNENVSKVSAIPEVRARVGSWLSGMLQFGGCLVMEGRDIGTAVFPNTRHKFYLDADPVERTRRRSAEIAGAGTRVDVSAVGASLKRRDSIDSSRQKDPLKIAAGAVVINTTSMSIEEVARKILERVRSSESAEGQEASYSNKH